MKKLQVPESGWRPTEVFDAMMVDPTERCDRCELCNTRIRWVHVLENRTHQRVLRTGGCCAARLCEDYDALGIEKNMKNQTERRARFLNSAKWRRSSAGNRVRKIRGMIITVFEKHDVWRYSVKPKKKPVVFPNVRYDTESEAMLGAFEWFELFGS